MENNFGLILLDLVRTNKEKFLGLLRRNGVLVNTNISNENLTNMILKAMQKSESFKKETILLMGVLMVNSDSAFANFETSSNPFGNLPSFDPNIFSPKDTKSTTTKTDKPKKDFADTTVGGIFDKLMTGFNAYTNLKLAEAEKAKAGSAETISNNDLESQKLGNKGGKGKDDEDKGNVGLYIGLGVGGLALVGLLVYVISKNK